jgi:hypothetical protein
MSGPYAVEAFSDTIFFGGVNLGSTVFSPLLTTSYQHAYGNIYTSTSDIYTSTYATGIDTLLPGTTPVGTLFAAGKLPETAMFDSVTPTVAIPGNAILSMQLTAALAAPSNPDSPLAHSPLEPLFEKGFSVPYLIQDDYRVSYAINAATLIDGAGPLAPPNSAPTPAAIPSAIPNPGLAPAFYFRQALGRNDLRNPPWAPHSPTLLCGGDADPTVFYAVNTGTMQKFWSDLPEGLVTVLDINAAPSGSFARVQAAFQTTEAALLAYYLSAAGGGFKLADAEAAVAEQTHTAEAPFCTLAARSFFDTVLGE